LRENKNFLIHEIQNEAGPFGGGEGAKPKAPTTTPHLYRNKGIARDLKVGGSRAFSTRMTGEGCEKGGGGEGRGFRLYKTIEGCS